MTSPAGVMRGVAESMRAVQLGVVFEELDGPLTDEVTLALLGDVARGVELVAVTVAGMLGGVSG